MLLIAARLKYDRDENEVHLIKKNTENTGFFERFFKFFNWLVVEVICNIYWVQTFYEGV